MARTGLFSLAVLAIVSGCRSEEVSHAATNSTRETQSSQFTSANATENNASAEQDASVQHPVPVRPTPPQHVQPGVPVDLLPTADCLHPEVKEDCKDGFCNIPPGCFIMGSPRDRAGAAAYADVQVQVTLTHAFELGAAEVTRAQWLEVGFELPTRDVDVASCDDLDCPISNVNFYETLTFLNRYSELHGLEPCYELLNCSGTFGAGPICNRVSKDSSGNLECDRTEENGLVCDGPFLTADTPYLCEGYRLPTEAEWEYAARGGTKWATWLGDVAWQEPSAGCVGPNPNLDPIAWYCWNSESKAHEVKQKRPNPWGLYDVLGNVSEWTNTTISYGGYGQGPLIDPVGYWYDEYGYLDRNLFPVALDEQVLARQAHPTMRGGNCLFEALFNTTEKRSIFADAYQGSSVIGFRMARSIL